MEDSAVSTIAKNWLNTINPGFTNLIKEIKIVRDPNTQPLIKTNYQKPLSHITDTPFFAASMAHIFPQDRGVENAIAESETICQQIIDMQ